MLENPNTNKPREVDIGADLQGGQQIIGQKNTHSFVGCSKIARNHKMAEEIMKKHGTHIKQII